ncbi:hypothetical protein V6N12_040915 [Hibiscus sabdariffa]|uniref:Uncharacterized protein n=1 Tax=Hibiscus sabdariffa TaxID=183260 RepID=A0ABR2E526_9ROSI
MNKGLLPASPRVPSPRVASPRVASPRAASTKYASSPRADSPSPPRPPPPRTASPQVASPKAVPPRIVRPRPEPTLRNQHASANQIQAVYRGYKSEAGNENWDDSVITKEEREVRKQRKVEAAIKRKRAMAYAYSNQVVLFLPAYCGFNCSTILAFEPFASYMNFGMET